MQWSVPGRSYFMSPQLWINGISASRKAFASEGLDFDFSIKACSSQTCLSRGSRIHKSHGNRQRRNKFCNRCCSDSILDILIYVKIDVEESRKSYTVGLPAIFFYLENCTTRKLYFPWCWLRRKTALGSSVLNVLVQVLFRSVGFLVQERWYLPNQKPEKRHFSLFIFRVEKNPIHSSSSKHCIHLPINRTS